MRTEQKKDTKRVFKSPAGKIITYIKICDPLTIEGHIKDTFKSVSGVRWKVKEPRAAKASDFVEIVMLGRSIETGEVSHITTLFTKAN